MQNERVEVIVFGQHCLNTLGQIRSLRELGLSPDVVWVNGDDHSPRGSRNIRHFFAFDTVEEGFSFIRRHYCDDAVRYIILTDSDAVVSLLNRHYDALRPRFSFFNAGENGRLSEFMPKWTQCQLAERSGMRVPRSELVKKGDLPRALTYPIFTKSPDSLGRSWKKNALICRNQEELLEAYRTIDTDSVLLQEFVEKDNEVAIQGISLDGGAIVYAPIQGEYLRLQDGGFGTWKRNEPYHLGDGLMACIQKMLAEIRYTGVFEVEFLRDRAGELYFLEFNFRFTQYNLALTRMGHNFAEYYIDSLQGKALSFGPADIPPQTVINEPKDFREYVKPAHVRWKDWLRDLRQSDHYYLFDRNDKAYVFLYLCRSVTRRLKIRFKHLFST